MLVPTWIVRMAEKFVPGPERKFTLAVSVVRVFETCGGLS